MDRVHRDVRDEVEVHLSGHAAFDGRPAYLAISLGRMPVTDTQQSAGNRHRQVEHRAGYQRPAVDVPATRGPRRDGGVLAWLVGRHPHHAEKRGESDALAGIAGGNEGLSVDFPY